jgi:hypothetical protein
LAEIYPEYGGNRFVESIGKFLPDYMALHPRRYCSSRKTLLKTHVIVSG